MSTTQQFLTCTNTDCGKNFILIDQEKIFYKEKNLPSPDICPACRHKQRMALRSERHLYDRICDHCGDQMLSTYPQNAPYTVYCQKCFWENIG